MSNPVGIWLYLHQWSFEYFIIHTYTADTALFLFFCNQNNKMKIIEKIIRKYKTKIIAIILANVAESKTLYFLVYWKNCLYWYIQFVLKCFCHFPGNKVISQLLASEPAPLRASPDPVTPDSDLKTLMTLCDLLNRELLVMISWAKHIPGERIVKN